MRTLLLRGLAAALLAVSSLAVTACDDAGEGEVEVEEDGEVETD
ncbi:MAG TPA: hypothetical protein VFO41_02190 [Alphaproteobacteria bacterium]|nr:hypothetical protein [Alphaproteobacteria bacterium]